jgi:hypothetical protein
MQLYKINKFKRICKMFNRFAVKNTKVDTFSTVPYRLQRNEKCLTECTKYQI